MSLTIEKYFKLPAMRLRAPQLAAWKNALNQNLINVQAYGLFIEQSFTCIISINVKPNILTHMRPFENEMCETRAAIYPRLFGGTSLANIA